MIVYIICSLIAAWALAGILWITGARTEPGVAFLQAIKANRRTLVAVTLIVTAPAVLFGFLVYRGLPAGIGIFLWCLLVVLLTLALSDVLVRKLLDYHMLLLGGIGVALRVAIEWPSWTTGVLLAITFGIAAGLIALALYGIGWIVGKRVGQQALGEGDPWLITAMGIALGPEATLMAILVAAIFGVTGHAAWHKRRQDRHMPLGLYLSLAGIVLLVLGAVFGPISSWIPTVWRTS